MFPLRSIVFPGLLVMFNIIRKFPEFSGNFLLILNFLKIYNSNLERWYDG